MTAEKDARRRLLGPTLQMLPRVKDSLSFLYIEAARIVQDDTGICAQVESKRGIEKVEIPTASIACVLLGPGTSITQPAMATFARHGTTLTCVGMGVTRCYSSILPDSMKTTWLERQVRLWSNDADRLQVAYKMYEKRFKDEEVSEGTTLTELRGQEGRRMKALYRAYAEKTRTARFRRSYNPENWDDQDPVNLAYSAANHCLYGVVHAVILALGCSPALGFVHTGKQHSFVYDMADLYKAEVTVPLAFSLHDSDNPEAAVRRKLRDKFKLVKLIPTAVRDIQQLLDPDTKSSEDDDIDTELISLWDPDAGALPGGVNYGEDSW